MIKQVAGRFSLIFLLFLAMSVHAETLKISLESDELYFKALPYLEKIDEAESELFSIRGKLSPGEKISDDYRQSYRKKVQALLSEGVPPLKQSADEGNPAAQYRLAWLSSHFDDREQVVDQVCSLLRSSLSQGFAPAGLKMLFYCFDEVKTPGFLSLIEQLPASDAAFSKYYPQPAMLSACRRLERETAVIYLDGNGFRANLYMSLATAMMRRNLKEEYFRYLDKAAEYGCAKALEKLKSKATS
ncbi:hypothetical protein [Pseudomonas sp. S2_E01]